jgi:hypothetical protein
VQRRRRIVPARECLRTAAWFPPRGGTSDSFAALAFTGHGAPAGATNDDLVTVPPGTRTNNRLATTVFVCALGPARGQPRAVALAVRLRALTWLPTAPHACCHDLRMLEGVAPQTDLIRTAITGRINGLLAPIPPMTRPRFPQTDPARTDGSPYTLQTNAWSSGCGVRERVWSARGGDGGCGGRPTTHRHAARELAASVPR